MPHAAFDVAAVTVAELTVTYMATRSVELDEPETDELIRWSCELAVIEDEDFDRPEIPLAAATIVVARPREWTLAEILDSDSADMSRFTLLCDERGLLAGDVPSGDLIVLERLWVNPQYRGLGFGPLLAAQAVTDLGSDCGYAAGEPAPFELEFDDPAHPAAQQRLRTMWARYGLELTADGLAIIELESAELENARRAAIDRINRRNDRA